jgi:Mrp family chromosome partitioning ATPase
MQTTGRTGSNLSEREEPDMAGDLLRSEIQAAVREIQHPELEGRSLQDLGMIRGISVEESTAKIRIALPQPHVPIQSQLETMVRNAVHNVHRELQVQTSFQEMSPRQRARFFTAARGQDPEGLRDQDVDNVLAVMSGKGGVGKSSVAALLACALQRRGMQVGILDADITGPSIPKLFGVKGGLSGGPDGIRPPCSPTGVRLISINLLLSSEDEPVVWRGPLIGRAIEQFWNDICWGRLDYLIVDLPPGTADAALTVMQSLPLDGIVLVTSPQHLAGMVVRKAANMAKRLGVPLTGLIENMSHLICPRCGARIDVFGPSQARTTAALAGIPLLGDIPLDTELAVKCDAGAVESYRTPSFESIAAQIAQPEGARRRLGSSA